MSHHNIEKSAYRKGEYVGYADGAWRISRNGNGWQARKGAHCLIASTLGHLSLLLEQHQAVMMQEQRASRLPNPFAMS